MRMIVGLGNPGIQYRSHRHNLGFMAIDHFIDSYHLIPKFKEQKQALTLKTMVILSGNDGVEKPRDILLVKPLTYMNLSGNAVQQLMSFYKVPLIDLLIISEDVNLPFGVLKILPKGGSGGHNGLKSIYKHLGKSFPRLRFGVGYNSLISLEQFVLSNFTQQEREQLSYHLDLIVQIMANFVANHPLDKLMSKYNGNVNKKRDDF